MYERNRPSVFALVKGRWEAVFTKAGISDSFESTKKEGPCPACGGNTRFRWLRDFQNHGSFYCRHCPGTKDGVGDGWLMLQNLSHLHLRNVADAARFVEEALDIRSQDGTYSFDPKKLPPKAVPQPKGPTNDELRESYLKLWNEGELLTWESPAGKYLLNRAPGLDVLPSDLRFHRALPYWVEKSPSEIKPGDKYRYRLLGRFPGMLAYCQSSEGQLATIWRYFLTDDGHKADVPEAKKAAGRWLTNDLAIRLFESNDAIATCEGLETALGAWVMDGVPIWPAMNALGVERFDIPVDAGCRRLLVYEDHDLPKPTGGRGPDGKPLMIRRGQASADVLTRRMEEQGIAVFRRRAAKASMDFADINESRQSRMAR